MSFPLLAATFSIKMAPSMVPSAFLLRPAPAAAIAALVAAAVFLNSLSGALVYDDLTAVAKNPDVIGHDHDGIGDYLRGVFQHDFWGADIAHPRSHKSYRPLAVVSLRLTHLAQAAWDGHGAAHAGDPSDRATRDHSDDPTFFHHAANVALHAAVTAMFVIACGRCVFTAGGGRVAGARSLLAGLVFALHPVHADAVASVCGRAELLSALFFLASLLCYDACRRRDGTGGGGAARVVQAAWFAAAVAAAACALLSKEQGLTALLVCAALDVVGALRRQQRGHRQGRRRRAARVRVALLAATGAALLERRLALMRTGAPGVFTARDNPAAFALGTSRLSRALSHAHAHALHARALAWPAALSADWSLGSVYPPLVTSLLDARNAATALLYGALAALLWRGSSARRAIAAFLLAPASASASGSASDRGADAKTIADADADAVTIGLALLVLPFLPASNLFYPVGFVVAERVLYIPSLGFAVLVARFVVVAAPSRKHQNKAAKRKGWRGMRWPRFAIAAAGLCLLAGRTVVRNDDWRDEEALMRAGLRVFPGNARLLVNRGWALARRARARERAGDAAEAEALLAGAHRSYREAAALQPFYAQPPFNIGGLLNSEGRTAEALVQFAHAAALATPSSPTCIKDAGGGGGSGGGSGGGGQQEQPPFCFREARPTLAADAHAAAGACLRALGRAAEALGAHRRALSADPAHRSAYSGHFFLGAARQRDAARARARGAARTQRARLDQALDRFRASIALRPAFSAARVALGRVLFDLGGRDPEAARSLRTAVALAPFDSGAWHALSTVLRAVAAAASGASGAAAAADRATVEAEAAMRRAYSLRPEARPEASAAAARRPAAGERPTPPPTPAPTPEPPPPPAPRAPEVPPARDAPTTRRAHACRMLLDVSACVGEVRQSSTAVAWHDLAAALRAGGEMERAAAAAAAAEAAAG